MNISFLDMGDEANELNGRTIDDREELLRILDGLRSREPFVCKLAGENGFELDVGIGKKGCVQYGRSDGLPPYLMAVASSPDDPEGETEFLMTGTPTPISNVYCIPFERVREIVGYFVETGRAHPAFVWKPV
jgi:hypothetical protein